MANGKHEWELGHLGGNNAQGVYDDSVRALKCRACGQVSLDDHPSLDGCPVGTSTARLHYDGPSPAAVAVVHMRTDEHAPWTCGACGTDLLPDKQWKFESEWQTSPNRCTESLALNPLPAAPPVEKVNHPRHYNAHPAGIECITVIEHMTFNVGSAVKYLWRAGLKPGEAIETDLRKAIFYIEAEIKRLAGKKS